MDPIINRLQSRGILNLNVPHNYCFNHGIVYQADMSNRIEYNEDYYNTYKNLENSEIAIKLNKCRINTVMKYCRKVIDIGIGSGEFIKKSTISAYGFDINSSAIKWLKENDIFYDPYANKSFDNFDGVTFWDSLEHMENPSEMLGFMSLGQYAFISMPIINEFPLINCSKHFKPNEHFYYFSTKGLIFYLRLNGFELMELNSDETLAGREEIKTFVFRKVA